MKKNRLKRDISYKSDFSVSQTSKKFLRTFYSQKLNKMSLSQKRHKIQKINQLILNLPFLEQARFISVYKALKQEPCLSSFVLFG
ncbi:MAG: hypothetical protein OXN83_01280 [Oligoflexia bacterium]|nr:hypothetical protein [Oligoflexia bacterium]